MAAPEKKEKEKILPSPLLPKKGKFGPPH